MKLKSYIDSFPRHERMRVRGEIAALHDVSEVSVRSWANGNRRHPCKLQAIKHTERFTRGLVSRHDLRPDIFGARPAKTRTR